MNIMGERRAKRDARSLLRYGHERDNQAFLGREAALWSRAKARGLTPQEYYGSPVAGQGGPSGGAQVLGNVASQAYVTSRRATSEAMQAEADRQVQRRGQDTQLEIAKIQAGQQQRSLDQVVREYENVTLPKAAKELKVREADLKVRLNEIATSAPAFVKQKILLQMGVENTQQTIILRKYGLDDLDQSSIDKLTSDEIESLLGELFAAGSYLNKEIEGAKGQVEKSIDWLIDKARPKPYRPSLGRPDEGNKNWIPNIGAPG